MRQLCIVGSFAAALAAGVLRADLNVLDWVDPFIGTGGNGHTTPAAAYPFGMVQPQSRYRTWRLVPMFGLPVQRRKNRALFAESPERNRML